MEVNYILTAFIVGSLLDTLLGDPYSLPHPIRLFGNTISFFEKRYNLGDNKRVKGGFVWIFLTASTFTLFTLANIFLISYPILWVIWTAVFFYYGISNRCLIDEALKVEKFLTNDDIEGARQQLSMIVGRDTRNMSTSKIRAAILETISENLSDGVVAPLLYFSIGGIPLMFCYKMINTLDSMVGYKNEKYGDFGYVSAKMDDIANFIPARLTAIMMVIVSFSIKGFIYIFKYGDKHSSPNSGYPEAVLAGILNCKLGGDSYYGGKLVKKPYLGDNSKELAKIDIINGCFINGKVALLSFFIIIQLIYFNIIKF